MSDSILIVEDDRKISETIRLYLEREGYQVSAVFNGRDAVAEARENRPALIVLDLMLPEISGLEVCRVLRCESDAYIIMLTARTTENDKLKGLDSGADDYVTKPFSPRELVARVRAVLRRQRPQPNDNPPQIKIKELTIDLERREVFVGGQKVFLTPAEFKLLEVFARAPERAFARDELIERAFGFDYDGLDRTVDAHVMNLRKKIEARNLRSPHIKTIFGIGYKLTIENDVL